jgi:FKBP-type peptidyl-prolyl cis-trans isomerase
VVIKSVRLLTAFAVDKARAAALEAKAAQEDRLGKLIKELEEKAGAKMVTTESGLRYVDFVIGSGQSPVPGTVVEFQYRGRLIDGTEFESTYSAEAVEREIERLIAGLREGISTMKEGGRRTLIVPPELAFGAYGVPGKIPPDAMLIFEVELLAVK